MDPILWSTGPPPPRRGPLPHSHLAHPAQIAAAHPPLPGWRRSTVRYCRACRGRSILRDQDRAGGQVSSSKSNLARCTIKQRETKPKHGSGRTSGMKTVALSRFLPPGTRTCYLHAKSRIWTPALPMTSRIRLLITAAMLCHLLLAPRLVTSQLLPASSPEKNPAPAPVKHSELVSISAVHQEKEGELYKLRGDVEIDDGVFKFHGAKVTYDRDSGNIQAEVHLLLEVGPNHEHIQATRP